MSNYRKIDLSTIPDCCLSCAYGDWDGEGCETLSDNGYGIHREFMADNFVNRFFHISKVYECVPWAVK